MTAVARREQTRYEEDLDEGVVDEIDDMTPEDLAKLDHAIDESRADFRAGRVYTTAEVFQAMDEARGAALALPRG